MFSTGDWSDDARDVLNFLLHFLPSSITGPDVPLPVALLPVSLEENTMRMIGVFNDRNLFAVGHSYGGCLWYVTHP